MASVTKKSHEKGLNLVLFEPESNWTAPTDFPDLSGEKIIAIDTETCDPYLLDRGPGFIRGDARVVGISIAIPGRSWYYPFGHLGGGNLDRDAVVAYVRDICSVQDRWVVGANLKYDLEGLDHLGIQIGGRCVDIQVAEALIDEERTSYSLDSISRTYLGVGKGEDLLKEAASCYGVDPKSGLWKLPAKFVGPYAETDAQNTLQIFEKQTKILQEDGLMEIFELESKLIPVIYKMRKQGIRVDLEAAEKLSEDFKEQEDAARMEAFKMVGAPVDEWSAPQLAKHCDKLGIKYPRTDKGRPSFESDWLGGLSHPFLNTVLKIRTLNRLRSTFIDSWIFKNEIRGRIHPEWIQLQRGDGGTRTGRMAASNPNPQQIPARSDLAPLIRRLFIPDEGLQWAKMDYSQQEPRILVHYADRCGFTGASLVREAYRTNKDMDIYQFLAESCGMSRRDAKDATLGRCYGMGAAKFALNKGLTKEQAKQKLEEFDRAVPFVKELSDYCMFQAQQRGWIKTLCGRKRHFNFYEPRDAFQMREAGCDTEPVRLNLAQEKWPGKVLQRAFTHKALNSLIQGSAADMTKSAMLQIYENTGKVPYMQVHDELNFGVTSQEEAQTLLSMAENCVEMTVPIKADLSYGKHWK